MAKNINNDAEKKNKINTLIGYAAFTSTDKITNLKKNGVMDSTSDVKPSIPGNIYNKPRNNL